MNSPADHRAGRVDLDTFESAIRNFASIDNLDRGWFIRVVTELRAARRVIDAERLPSRPHCSTNCQCERNQAWLAYDEAAAS